MRSPRSRRRAGGFWIRSGPTQLCVTGRSAPGSPCVWGSPLPPQPNTMMAAEPDGILVMHEPDGSIVMHLPAEEN